MVGWLHGFGPVARQSITVVGTSGREGTSPNGCQEANREGEREKRIEKGSGDGDITALKGTLPVTPRPHSSQPIQLQTHP
jgi:hypothetical protein